MLPVKTRWRGPKDVVTKGATPVLSPAEAPAVLRWQLGGKDLDNSGGAPRGIHPSSQPVHVVWPAAEIHVNRPEHLRRRARCGWNSFS